MNKKIVAAQEFLDKVRAGDYLPWPADESKYSSGKYARIYSEGGVEMVEYWFRSRPMRQNQHTTEYQQKAPANAEAISREWDFIP